MVRAQTHQPWHRGLTREAVVGGALAILDDEGREALTMRHLAAALGVEAPSLYAHVRNKDELIDAVLDGVLDGVSLPEVGPDPRASLAAGFRSYRAALLSHPTSVVLLTERARASAAQYRLARRSIELLEMAGLTNRQAVDGHVTLVAYALGFILQEVSRPISRPAEAAPDALMARTLKTLAERSVDERFDVGLELIFDGIGLPRKPATR
jgi:AcrR family transcriptional regulator